jgi:hypothetical protein
MGAGATGTRRVLLDHMTGDRFWYGTKILRWQPDKSPPQRAMEQIMSLSVGL